MNHYTFKGLVKHVENWSAAAESRDKRLWKLYLLSSCLSRHQTCAEFRLCDSVRNKTKWRAKNQTHPTATLNEEWCNADSIILNSFPLDCIHNTYCRQLNIFECMCTCISMNDSDCTHTVCAYMFFFLPWGLWSPPQPQRWSPPAQSLLAAAGSPGRDERPAGC